MRMNISGSLFAQAVISAANHIINEKSKVDELNVFPVPDGDTGTNMSMTMTNGKKAVEALEESAPIGEVAKTFATALLRGARGNSGVILSLLFRGFSKGLKGRVEANGSDVAYALKLGTESAYKAVMNPTEGTILTVARLASEAGEEAAMAGKDAVEVFDVIVSAAKQALDQTPELLPVLKKAGVVDAGGMGLYTILLGMQVVFQGKEGYTLASEKPKTPAVSESNPFAQFDEVINFTYCTEFIVNKNKESRDPLALRAYLESIGDCVVVVDDDSIIKVHVHTDHPGKAFEEGLLYGSLVNMKVENMREQNAAKKTEAMAKEAELPWAEPKNPYGFVAVAAGAGVQSLFADLGVDRIVSGGQTMNPSTDDILQAVEATPAQTVFVLPNNKNIIMAAEQAEKLADRRVCVLQTRSIPQGLSAMLAFDPDSNFQENRVNMTRALDRVQSGQITFAARDSDYEGHKIRQGEILALDGGKLDFVEDQLPKALYRLTRHLVKKSDAPGFITILYGSDVNEDQAQEAVQPLRDKFGDSCEISLVNGGQPVYYYIISVE